jgi:hypothetical protein
VLVCKIMVGNGFALASLTNTTSVGRSESPARSTLSSTADWRTQPCARCVACHPHASELGRGELNERVTLPAPNWLIGGKYIWIYPNPI